MLKNIPEGIAAMSRSIISNHPNRWSVQVLKSVYTRQSDGVMGGIPTLGGVGVLDYEDESERDFVLKGYGYALSIDGFVPSSMTDWADATQPDTNRFTFLIEPIPNKNSAQRFEIEKRDIILVMLTNDIETSPKIAYEVVGIDSTVNIAPYTKRFICNKAQHLDINVPWGI